MSKLTLPRRKFLLAGASLLATPSIVRAGSMTLLGVGKAPGAPAKFLSAVQTNFDNGTSTNPVVFSANIGTATATRVVIVATSDTSAAISAVSVGGVSATLLTSHPGVSDGSVLLWQVTGSSPGSGSQSVSVTGGIFTARLTQVWVMDGLTSTTVKQVAGAGAGGSSWTIPVVAGDYMVAIGGQTGSVNFGPSTQAPSNSYGTEPADFALAADWNAIVSTNASFTVSITASGVGVSATFS
jgi:hypothetical protein